MKNGWKVLLATLTLAAMAVPALAQTTGIALDGKTYCFTGGAGTYEADGKTFIIGEDEVVIREAGKADICLPLYATGEGEMQETAKDRFYFVGMDSSEAIASIVDDAVCAEVTLCESAADAVACCMEGVAVSASEKAQAQNGIDAATFAPYARFGLSVDVQKGALYYRGERVRVFEDGYSVGDQGRAVVEHLDALGTVDVRAVRDLTKKVYNADGSQNPGGVLTGLEALSAEEFAARDFDAMLAPQSIPCTASEGGAMSPEERAALYAPYAEFGVVYNAGEDQLYYNGQRVRDFLDVKQSNGASFSSGDFHGVMTHIAGERGEVDVRTIRNYGEPDAEGNGKLIGVQVIEIK